MKRLGALGTLVWDRIHHPSSKGAPVEQWGGMLYSLCSLSVARPVDWSVQPLLKLGNDLADAALEMLRAVPGLEIGSAIRRVPEGMNRVELIYSDAHRRGERLTGGVPSWTWDELEPHLSGLDALYINFISGFEVELETAKRVRRVFSGPIYADLHSLFLGCPGAGVRDQRALPSWQEWVTCFDVIQVNERELSLLAAGTEPETFADRLLDLGPEMVVTTLGAEGARVHARHGRYWSGSPERLSCLVPTTHASHQGDPTGCGDVWGSAFFMSILGAETPLTAAARAHAFAARNIQAKSTDTLYDSLRDLAQLPQVS